MSQTQRDHYFWRLQLTKSTNCPCGCPLKSRLASFCSLSKGRGRCRSNLSRKTNSSSYLKCQLYEVCFGRGALNLRWFSRIWLESRGHKWALYPSSSFQFRECRLNAHNVCPCTPFRASSTPLEIYPSTLYKTDHFLCQSKLPKIKQTRG